MRRGNGSGRCNGLRDNWRRSGGNRRSERSDRRGRRGWLQPSGAGSSFLGLPLGDGSGLRGGIGVSLSMNRAADFFSDVHRDGAGVSFLLRDAEAGQKVDDGLCFDFELAGQLVNSNLIGVGHALRSGHLLLRSLFVVFFWNFFGFGGWLSIGNFFGRLCRRCFRGSFF
jgi:hypothetical protein